MSARPATKPFPKSHFSGGILTKKYNTHGYTDLIIPLISVIVVIVMVSSVLAITQDHVEDSKGQVNTTELGASYIIYQDGMFACAKNGITSRIDFKGTDAGAVISDAAGALSNGGSIIVKEGEYLISSTIHLNVSGVSLSGSGLATIIKAAPDFGEAPMLTVGDKPTTTYNVAVKSLQLDGSKGDQTSGSVGILIVKAEYCDIESVYVKDLYTTSGISLHDSHHVKIDKCSITGIGTATTYGNGIAAGNRIAGSITSDVVISDTFISDFTNAGIDIEPGRNITIQGCIIENGGNWGSGKEAHGIYLGNPIGWPVCENIIIDGNSIRAIEGAGIFSIGIHSVSVTNNQIQDCYDGLYVSSGERWTVQGNIMAEFVRGGINLYRTSDSAVMGNTILNPNLGGDNMPGIRITGGNATYGWGEYIIVMGNYIQGGYRGITVDHTCDYITVVGNIAVDATNPIIVGGSNSINANNQG